MTENRRKAEDKLRGFGGVCKNTAIGCGIKRAGRMASGKRAGRKQDAGAGRKPGMRLGMLCLTASLSVSLPMTAWASPEFAYSTEKWASLRDNVMEYEELADDARYTPEYQSLYRRRKETIERVFADAKEKHAMRYTQYRGLAQVTNWVKLKFAAMNLKKLATWKRRDLLSFFRFAVFSLIYVRAPVGS